MRRDKTNRDTNERRVKKREEGGDRSVSGASALIAFVFLFGSMAVAADAGQTLNSCGVPLRSPRSPLTRPGCFPTRTPPRIELHTEQTGQLLRPLSACEK